MIPDDTVTPVMGDAPNSYSPSETNWLAASDGVWSTSTFVTPFLCRIVCSTAEERPLSLGQCTCTLYRPGRRPAAEKKAVRPKRLSDDKYEPPIESGRERERQPGDAIIANPSISVTSPLRHG
jgi:hypothetical protein